MSNNIFFAIWFEITLFVYEITMSNVLLTQENIFKASNKLTTENSQFFSEKYFRRKQTSKPNL